MGLFLFQETAQWREAARCSSVTFAMASLALSLESLWSGSCMWGKSRIQWKEQGEIWHRMVTLESLFWPTNRKRICLFHMKLLFSNVFEFPTLFAGSLFWCSANGYPVLCFLTCFLCLWSQSTMTVWAKTRIKVGVIWNGVSHHISWNLHGFNSFRWKKWYLQCLKRAALSVWNLLLI